MSGKNTQFDEFIAGEVRKYKGIYVPVKSSVLRRIFIKKAACAKLHPNPGDEFCVPGIGPNYEIVSNYEQEFRTSLRKSYMRAYTHADKHEPLIVERIRPDGYLILNGHHRWAAAVRSGLPALPIKIVNLTQETDIRKMLQTSRHNKRVTLDLDEVVFRAENDGPLEKALSFPLNRVYRERLRLGVPALFRFLNMNGYDIWVYTARYYSFDYIRRLFKMHNAHVSGIVTGTARKTQAGQEERKAIETLIANKYSVTVHIDNGTVLRIAGDTKTFEEYRLSGSAAGWSGEIMDVMEAWKTHE